MKNGEKHKKNAKTVTEVKTSIQHKTILNEGLISTVDENKADSEKSGKNSHLLNFEVEDEASDELKNENNEIKEEKMIHVQMKDSNELHGIAIDEYENSIEKRCIDKTFLHICIWSGLLDLKDLTHHKSLPLPVSCTLKTQYKLLLGQRKIVLSTPKPCSTKCACTYI